MKSQDKNYNSHKWETKDDYTSGEYVTFCSECGIEDRGTPEEFDIKYPNCNIINDRVHIVLPEGVKDNPDLPFCAHGMKVFIGDKEVKNLTNIVVTYPVNGPVQIHLTILASGGDTGLDYDATADIEVTQEAEKSIES